MENKGHNAGRGNVMVERWLRKYSRVRGGERWLKKIVNSEERWLRKDS
jgi:hypothetical protein